jgi:aminomethyltransferase
MEKTMLKQTSLYAAHQAAKATLVPFAGWDMPVSYAGTVSEVQATRIGVGLFDVSHMGEVEVIGEGALAFMQNVTANDVSRLALGEAQYSLFLNERGGVIDDIIVYRVHLDKYVIVLNAGCKDKDWEWLRERVQAFPEVTLRDNSDNTSLIAVQGPQTVSMIQRLTGVGEVPRFQIAETDLAGHRVVLSRTGYTGEDGFEIFIWSGAEEVWSTLVSEGATPCGLGARDVLRLEAAYPLYGHELDADTNALECGVGWAIKLNKGDFLGRAALLQAKAIGVARRLVGLRMTERAIPREGCAVFNAEGAEIGRVTSGTFSPTLSAGIALARLDRAAAHDGSPVQVDIRGRRAPALIVPLPFYRNGV